jgi:hypothetical protein
MQSGFDVVAAKSKKDQDSDAPAQVAMSRQQGIRRNPSGDQKKVRTQQARNARTAAVDAPRYSKPWIKDWLLNNYVVNDEYGAALVDCVLAHADLTYFDAQVERYRGMESGENAPGEDAEGFMLSSLVETHEAPHNPNCPYAPGGKFASKTAAKPKPRIAGEGAYITDAHDSSIRKDVAPGTQAQPMQGYATWTGSVVYDWSVEGHEGDGWQLGGTWTEVTLGATTAFRARVQAALAKQAVSTDVLYDIQARDPNAGPVQPTEGEQAAFQTWVIQTYGESAWDEYQTPGWAEGNGYEGSKTALAGDTVCPACGGKGYYTNQIEFDRTDSLIGEEIDCPTCGGVGYVRTPGPARTEGSSHDPDDAREDNECGLCDGTGEVYSLNNDSDVVRCPGCRGTGRTDTYIDNPASLKESTMTIPIHREAQILQALAVASPQEQQRLLADLEALRSQRVASRMAQAEIDMDSTVIADHLTPVVTHSYHSAATDWIDEVGEEESGFDHNAMLTEATLWFRRTSSSVKADREEFAAQAQGYALRTASQFGTRAPEAARLFLDQVAHLHRTAGTETGDNGQGVSGLPDEVPLEGHEDTLENFQPPVAPVNSWIGPEDVASTRAPNVTARRRTAAEGGQTCEVCGAAIERDPAGEEPRTWHHNDGSTHDHEAKPKGGDSKESSRRQAGGLENLGDDRAPEFDDEDEDDDKKKGSRRLAVSYDDVFLFEASDPIADPSGQSQSGLRDVEVGGPNDQESAWPWELDENGERKAKDAADVASVPTPGGESGYPQPTASRRPFGERTAVVDVDGSDHDEPYSGETNSSSEACDVVPWGHDTNGDEWSVCKTHGYMVLGDAYVCEGYEPPPYTGSLQVQARSISEIASDIRREWSNVYFGAVPYLDAMDSLDSINDRYYEDDAKSIVAYFLSNASGFRGEKAKALKAELKALGSKTAGSDDLDHGEGDEGNEKGYWGDEPDFDSFEDDPDHEGGGWVEGPVVAPMAAKRPVPLTPTQAAFRERVRKAAAARPQS